MGSAPATSLPTVIDEIVSFGGWVFDSSRSADDNFYPVTLTDIDWPRAKQSPDES